jgi:hypothetical protein
MKSSGPAIRDCHPGRTRSVQPTHHVRVGFVVAMVMPGRHLAWHGSHDANPNVFRGKGLLAKNASGLESGLLQPLFSPHDPGLKMLLLRDSLSSTSKVERIAVGRDGESHRPSSFPERARCTSEPCVKRRTTEVHRSGCAASARSRPMATTFSRSRKLPALFERVTTTRRPPGDRSGITAIGMHCGRWCWSTARKR